MRTIRTKVFKFSELKTEKATQRAIQWFRDGETYDYIYDEAYNTVEDFADLFNIIIRQFDFAEPYRSEYTLDIPDNILELSGQRLVTYIWNNYRHGIYKGKYYGKLVKTFKDGTPIPISKEHPAEMRHVKRYSKCQIESHCPFTGVCWDEEILFPLIEFMKKPDTRNLRELLSDCISSLIKSVNNEIEARGEDDAVIETIEANEYEFTQDGEIFNS